MRWRDMHGRITPIIRLMARWYAARSSAEVEDLEQEAWLMLLSRPNAPQRLAAQTAMANYVAKLRTLGKYDRLRWLSPYTPSKYSAHGHVDFKDLLAILDTREQSLIREYLAGYSTGESAARHHVHPTTVNRIIRKATEKLRCHLLSV